MDDWTLDALRGSIAKWEAIVDGTGEDLGTSNCPLCHEFYNNGCVGCPVSAATGKPRCGGTPYDDYDDSVYERDDDGPEAHEADEAAVRMRDFLVGLLPR